MADHLTEEEQIEAIKRWWNDNWLTIVLPIALAIVAYTGWNFWNDHNLDQAQQASDKYEQLAELVGGEPGATIDVSVRGEAKALANEIQLSYAGGLYADLSALISAKIAVEEGDLAMAEQALRGVADAGANTGVQEVAKARLAKVLLASERYSDALALVNASTSEASKALFAEVRGDVYMAQGEMGAARTAYQEAIDSLSPQQGSHRGMLQFKLDGAAAAAPASDAAADAALSTVQD